MLSHPDPIEHILEVLLIKLVIAPKIWILYKTCLDFSKIDVSLIFDVFSLSNQKFRSFLEQDSLFVSSNFIKLINFSSVLRINMKNNICILILLDASHGGTKDILLSEYLSDLIVVQFTGVRDLHTSSTWPYMAAR